MDKKRDRLPIFYSLTDKKQLSSNTIFRRVLLTVVSVEQMQHNGKTGLWSGAQGWYSVCDMRSWPPTSSGGTVGRYLSPRPEPFHLSIQNNQTLHFSF